MPFPISRTLEGRLPQSLPEATRSLSTTLARIGATDIRSAENEMTFSVPLTAGRPQSSVDSGRCTLESDSADSTLVTVRLAFGRTLAVLAVVVVLWLGAMARYVLGVTDPGQLIVFLALGFLWLHAFSYMVAGWWFRRELGLE